MKDCGASGSEFQTVASTKAGSRQIAVKDAGDFQVGQGVQISRAHVHYEKQRLWGPDYARGKALKDEVEISFGVERNKKIFSLAGTKNTVHISLVDQCVLKCPDTEDAILMAYRRCIPPVPEM